MSVCSSNPLRIPHSKIDKLAYQAQSVVIFAMGEICLRKFDATSEIGSANASMDIIPQHIANVN